MKQMNAFTNSIKLTVAAVCLLCSLSAQAVDWSFRAPHDAELENADEYEWEEEKFELPAYPDKDKMLQIRFDRLNPRFEFFIDPETLSVGEDGVVRYVLMLRSPSGSENIMFEGIRCVRRDYKTFAFGTSEDEFRKLRRPAWKEITQTSNNWYRYALWRDYFCSGGERQYVQITRENILRRLNGSNSFRIQNN